MIRVLLVDDKEVFLRTIKRMPFFQKYRDKVQILWTAGSAMEALKILRKEPVDIVLTDIRMPMMSGIDLLKVIRKERLCSCTILVSEYTEFSYAREGILYGAFDYIVKPLEDDVVTDTMNRALAFLQELDARQKIRETSADDLLRTLLISDEDQFEDHLRRLYQLWKDRMQQEPPEKTVQNIRRTQALILKSLAMDHANMEKYLPLQQLFTLPEETEDTGAEAATAYLVRSIRFLHKKMSLFHLRSENVQVQNIWYYTIGNADAPCRQSETARRFFLNPSYLSSLFKKETGISYKTFVQNLKMERARYLLAFSGKKIAEIAEQLNFTDTEYFRKTFKAATGVSPARFDYEEYIRETVGEQSQN